MGLDGQLKTVKEPYLVEEICNGCGICENVCPLEMKAGIEVFAVKNRTPISPQTTGNETAPGNPYP
jgi:ferredoxin